MNEPGWDDPGRSDGSMVRAALWLVQIIGEGNTFTKEQLRAAFPGVSQIDRRVRDLRDFGWILDTNASDATLTSDEQRFVQRGVDVWNPADRRAAVRNEATVTSKDRQATFAADGYQCVICGIAGGEGYPDKPSETAILSVGRRTTEVEGEQLVTLMTECKRCRSGVVGRSYSVSEVRALVDELSDDERRKLRRWLARGTRGTTALDRAWSGIRQLSPQLRADFASRI